MRLTEGIKTTDTSKGALTKEVSRMGEEDQGLLLEDLLVLEDLDMMGIKLTIKAEIHHGEETHLGGDPTRQGERNLSMKIVIGHARQIEVRSTSSASAVNARPASRSERSLWILSRKQRLG